MIAFLPVFLSHITFLNPFVLLGFLTLPGLWLLLRIFPPAPKMIHFPPIAFLLNIRQEKKTSAKSPWWILLLRLLITTLIILGLSGPTYSPKPALSKANTLFLIIDNSWASAHHWDQKMNSANDLLYDAWQNKKSVFLATTTPGPNNEAPALQGPMDAQTARTVLQDLKPHPWLADYDALRSRFKEKAAPHSDADVFWLGDDADSAGLYELAAELKSFGLLRYVQPSTENRAVILSAKSNKQGALMAVIKSAPNHQNAQLWPVKALSKSGSLIQQTEIELRPGDTSGTVSFDIPRALQKDISRLLISGSPSAAHVYIPGQGRAPPVIGIAGETAKNQLKPFVNAQYYLMRALEPFGEIHTGLPEDLLKHDPSLIILPDFVSITPQTQSDLKKWISDGGLLLRFGGPKTAKSLQNLPFSPARLRLGGRALGGDLSWDKPLKFNAWTENSPLEAIRIADDIIINKQILADPVFGNDVMIWAALEDSTPFITARKQGQGLIAMIHTSAGPEWSNFALSGTYVKVLEYFADLSKRKLGKNAFQKTKAPLYPVWILDGFGNQQTPGSLSEPIPTSSPKNIRLSNKTPPGLYQNDSMGRIINLGDTIQDINPAHLPGQILRIQYDNAHEIRLMPWLILGACVLFLIDWALILAMRFRFLLFAIILISPHHSAQAATKEQYTYGLYLGYIQTGEPTLDAISHQGLENLSAILKSRTSAQPQGIVALDPNQDELTLLPFIYWPISQDSPRLSERTISNVRSYLASGGLILFDMRGMKSLPPALQDLALPPINPMPPDHTLARSYYLLEPYSGQYAHHPIWIDDRQSQQEQVDQNYVSSIIVGSDNWAQKWAYPDTYQESEIAYRFGVNVVLYALTGNYKTDQIHIPHILERLGQ